MKLFITIFALGILFLSYSCRKEKASWSTNWSAPVAKDTLRIADYVNDTTLAINGDQSVQIVLERDVVEFDINDILVLPDTSISQTLSINVPSLNLSPGTTFIDDVKEHTFNFEGAALSEARLSTGTAQITIENPIPEGGIFLVELPGVTKDGVTFSHSEYVDGAINGVANTKTFELDLSGYSVDMTGEDGLYYNILQSKMTVTTDPDGSAVVVSSQDVFKFIVSFSDLKVDYGKGYFGQQVFSDTTAFEIEALKSIVGGNINIENVNFDIILYNGIKAEAQGKITQLKSKNYNGNEVELTHPYFDESLNINPAQWDWVTLTPSERVLAFQQSTTNIIPFIENLGDEYELGYEIELNPLGNTSGGNNELFPQSNLGAKIKADFPLVLGANDLTLRDTFAFSYEDKERLLRVENGSFLLSTNNRFPFGGSVQLRILDKDYNELTVIQQSDAISPATLNTSTNSHILEEQETSLDVSAEDILTFKDAEYIELEVVLNSTTSSNNVVYENAAIDFLLRANFQMRTEL